MSLWKASDLERFFEALDQALELLRCTCLPMSSRRWRIWRVDARVRVIELNPQGYGLQLVFSDGHERGIYPWAYLAGLTD
ncbi:gamma-butyrobetaine hydroxylase-like domain-containing protein [Pseudomonas laurylsulfatiphila]|uniref:gamma-butyrobetaine hydroxylase-like domain-containing protein n=1 Tax=Pseudomonas laurylsulfatiphila TaxID=2011015 RepID=UPI003D1B5166